MFNSGFFRQCVEKPFDYKFSQNPDRVPDIAAARNSGVNCISLLTVGARESGYFLPDTLTYELFMNEDDIATVQSLSEMQVGDPVWHGPDRLSPEDFVPKYNDQGFLVNWRDGPAQHISMFAGFDSSGDMLLLHASFKERMSTISTLGEIASNPRLSRIHRVGRLITPITSVLSATSGVSRMTG